MRLNKVNIFSLLLLISIHANAQEKGCIVNPMQTPRSENHSTALKHYFTQIENSSFDHSKNLHHLKDLSPIMFSASPLGVGIESLLPLKNIFFLRISLINFNTMPNGDWRNATSVVRSFIVPIQIGMKFDILDAERKVLEYTLYFLASAGTLAGWKFPVNGSFFNYSIPNSQFTTGASAYAGVGNTFKVSESFCLYVNGGVNYFNTLSDSFVKKNEQLSPALSLGFYFSFRGFENW